VVIDTQNVFVLRTLTHAKLAQFEEYVRSKTYDLPPYAQMIHEDARIAIGNIFAFNSGRDGKPIYPQPLADWTKLPPLELIKVLKAQIPKDPGAVARQFDSLEKRFQSFKFPTSVGEDLTFLHDWTSFVREVSLERKLASDLSDAPM
jgi:hypothetical protein